MKATSRNTQKVDKGVAAVEFALILPLLMMMIFGIINYGLLLYDQAVITNAAREGARWGSIKSSGPINCTDTIIGNANPCQVANNYTNNNLITFGTPNLLTTGIGAGTTGSTVTITVAYTFNPIGYFMGSSRNALSATAVMYHE